MGHSALHEAYTQTDFVVTTPVGDVTLRVGSPPVGNAAAIATVAGRRVTVVTGWNPRSVPQDTATNRDANDRLRAVIDSSGWAWWVAVGRGRPQPGTDGQSVSIWSEDSFAILDVDATTMCLLGRAFDQNAIFQWDGDHGSIVWCHH